MSHVPHILHWMFHETKLGGGVAIAGIVIAAFIAFNVNPVMQPSPACVALQSDVPSSPLVRPSCPQVLAEEALLANLFLCLCGGALGVGIAAILVDRGVDRSTLGITED